jgi:hypothetical protein
MSKASLSAVRGAQGRAAVHTAAAGVCPDRSGDYE